ncbi:glucose 1-dehydrogenase [Parvibaculum sp.]|jgi:NAD(P)-dependent dehydrogenase (short-subunit alcohol dehydrogenase family)|uniref:glucose 1-dehydrogenase n=1 Tax=Parvibaculum sp. TaxID=2024848 RepID=UPI000C5CCC59|nr:glucose 1-dehydrogenase [Parvibaculum sp.]MAU60099.1 3-beta hydroxysteroid dehydrogenase [Parvibaculum sp.]MBO6669707.1 glucose 1-dehydrogenase [Parvibaculum sp.]MBO6693658.1 glucose 1-dehydrogenase [Parvibaculum sp.]MBO6716214.1 glucose 1-dehydrogenase [Parvibaculum sp.]
MGRVSGKVAIVTGAAKGLGEATAKALAREGAKVVCSDLDEAAGQAVADAIANEGGAATFIRHDVVNEAEWEAVVKHAEDRFGGLHVLVNNAGIAPEGGPIEEKTLESWRRTIAIDLDSVFLGCKHGIRAIKKYTAKGGAGGSIINLSSILGLVGQPNASDYNAAKGGVRLLTKSAALECAEAGYNIRVNSIHPGYIDTPMVKDALNRGVVQGQQVGPNEMRELLIMMHPIGRLGVADEIANAALFLASDESSFMTGSEVVVDGGYTTR